ncbi:MAG TPA: hypothetical protein VGD91_06230 [Trebonia sp.]
MSGAEDEVHAVLSAALTGLTGLTGKDRLTVAEFGAAGAVIVRVYRDENGTPRAEEPRPEARAAALRSAESFYRELNPAFIVRTAESLPAELAGLLPGHRGVPVYQCRTPLKKLVQSAIGVSPLVLSYELALLTPLPDGRLEVTSRPLFPVGAETGHETRLTVRCAAADGDGTAFAVVTREPRPDIPPRERRLRPVQIQSAVVPPGTFQVTARLERPGRVSFQGIPGLLGSSPGPPAAVRQAWDERLLAVPDRLARSEPVHLVCLVEVSGGEQRLAGRLEWLAKLVKEAESGLRDLRVSVLAYGPHSVSWSVDEEPYRLLAWLGSAQTAEQALNGLADQVSGPREYLDAAQLECVLEGLARHLPDGDGRPVVVTAGGRPPHPPGMDTGTGIIPCPDRVDWTAQLDRIGALGATFGALRDERSTGAVWRALGRDAAATVDVVDIADFAARLGLHEAARPAPFPFADQSVPQLAAHR